jgi:hypothetical protein
LRNRRSSWRSADINERERAGNPAEDRYYDAMRHGTRGETLVDVTP